MEAIDELLEKYWEGETTLAEERQIKEYFARTKNLPPHLETYRGQFAVYADWQQETALSGDFDVRLEKKLQSSARVIAFRPVHYWAAGIAAGIALFCIGFFSGRQTQPEQLATIQSQVKELRETVVMAQLKQPSASERIKGVNYVYEMQSKSPEVIDALIETLNTDENTNVRLAAANALFTFKDDKAARQALIQSIHTQSDPSVKIALINIMIALKDKKTKPVIEEFLKKEPIPQQIKENIRNELKAI
jgi:hypothetical protein